MCDWSGSQIRIQIVSSNGDEDHLAVLSAIPYEIKRFDLREFTKFLLEKDLSPCDQKSDALRKNIMSGRLKPDQYEDVMMTFTCCWDKDFENQNLNSKLWFFTDKVELYFHTKGCDKAFIQPEVWKITGEISEDNFSYVYKSSPHFTIMGSYEILTQYSGENKKGKIELNFEKADF